MPLDARGRFRVVVDLDEAQVVVGDLLGGLAPVEPLVEEALQRVPPDRAADREAYEALHRRCHAQPLVDLLVRRAAAQQHRGDALAPLARAGLPDQHLRVVLRVDALDLPDVDLDPEVLDLLDRAPHQLRAELLVVAVLVTADRLELVVLGGHQQLEQELAVVLVQPVGELLEPAQLALVHLGVAVGIQTHEDLREVGVVVEDVLPEVLVVLEVELLLAGLLDRLGELEAVLARELRDVGAELLVDEHAGGVGVHTALDRDLHAFIDQLLGVADRVGLLRGGVALDPEHLLLEGAPVVEREDVELSVVAEGHGSSTFVVTWRSDHRLPSRAVKPNFSGPSYTLGIEEELMIVDRESWDLANAIEELLAESDAPADGDEHGGIKPELHESVLEIATTPCSDTREAGAQLRGLRRQVAEVAGRRDLTIGSAGTHPFARWEDQRISARP